MNDEDMRQWNNDAIAQITKGDNTPTNTLEQQIDAALHPERNGLLTKRGVAEGASHEHIIKESLAELIAQAVNKAERRHVKIYKWLLGMEGDFPMPKPYAHYAWRTDLRMKLPENVIRELKTPNQVEETPKATLASTLYGIEKRYLAYDKPETPKERKKRLSNES